MCSRSPHSSILARSPPKDILHGLGHQSPRLVWDIIRRPHRLGAHVLVVPAHQRPGVGYPHGRPDPIRGGEHLHALVDPGPVLLVPVSKNDSLVGARNDSYHYGPGHYVPVAG